MNEDQHDESAGMPEWRVPADEQLKADAYHVWKPRPLLRSVQWKPVPAPDKDAATGSYDVFLDQRVFKAMHQHLWGAAADETQFGFLVGDLCEDPDSGRRYVIVSTAIPSKFPLQEGPEQMPREALVALELETDRRKGVLAGWYRGRRGGSVELSAEDKKMHELHFPEPWQVVFEFITDHDDPRGGCFRRALRGLKADVPLPFYEMVSNESLLARGVRRSRMDWVNVETTDSIEPDPPSRPERPPEPELEVPADVPELHLPLADAQTGIEAADEPELPDAVEAAGSILPILDLEAPEDLEAPIEWDDDAVEGEERDAEAPGDVASEGREDGDLPLSGVDELLAELDATEEELDLPVLGEVEEDDTAGDGESLPEPEWDVAQGPDFPKPPSVDDVDLDAFVVEVEGADVEGQVGSVPDIEQLEPGWDEGASTEVAEPEADVETRLPVLEPDVPEPDLEPEPEGDLEPLESEIEATPEGSEAAGEIRREEPGPKRKARRPRRPVVLVIVLLVAAIATTLLIALGRSGSEPGVESGAPEATPTEAGSGGPAGQGAVVPPPEGAEGAGGGMVQSGPTAVADTAAPPATAADIKRLGDSLLESISRYYGQAVARDEGKVTCAELQASYVEVEDRWISYNVQGRARFRGRLPDEMATRDERLYAGVQDVEREFTRSGCERP